MKGGGANEEEAGKGEEEDVEDVPTVVCMQEYRHLGCNSVYMGEKPKFWRHMSLHLQV
jgi:hypothetical protein